MRVKAREEKAADVRLELMAKEFNFYGQVRGSNCQCSMSFSAFEMSYFFEKSKRARRPRGLKQTLVTPGLGAGRLRLLRLGSAGLHPTCVQRIGVAEALVLEIPSACGSVGILGAPDSSRGTCEHQKEDFARSKQHPPLPCNAVGDVVPRILTRGLVPRAPLMHPPSVVASKEAIG